MPLRKIAVAIVLSIGLSAAGAASAGVSGSVAIVSDYLFRGVTQTNGKPALQGGVSWTHDSGFHVGTWGSSISWLSDSDPDISSQVELDVFVGYAGSFGDSAVGYDVGLNYYAYPGDYPAGFNQADTVELFFGVSWKFLGARYWVATTDLFGIDDSSGSTNLDLSATWEFSPGWSGTAAFGKQWISGSSGAEDYTFWKVGVDKSFENGFAIGGSWNSNDLGGLDDSFILAVSKSF